MPSSATACAGSSPPSPTSRSSARPADGAEAVAMALALRPHLVILDVSMPRSDRPPGGGRARAPCSRASACSCSRCTTTSSSSSKRCAPGRRVRAEVRRRPRPRRGLPRDPARRVVPVPRCRRDAHQGSPRAGRGRRGACPTTRSRRARAEVLKLIAEAHTNQQIAELLVNQPSRPSRTTAPGSSRSSGCATASSSRATRSAAALSSRERRAATALSSHPTAVVSRERGT